MIKTYQPTERGSVDSNALEPPIEPLVDRRECSRITGRSVPSLDRDRMFGVGIPYIKVGGLIKYSPTDIRDFIQRNRCGGQKESK